MITTSTLYGCSWYLMDFDECFFMSNLSDHQYLNIDKPHFMIYECKTQQQQNIMQSHLPNIWEKLILNIFLKYISTWLGWFIISGMETKLQDANKSAIVKKKLQWHAKK